MALWNDRNAPNPANKPPVSPTPEPLMHKPADAVAEPVANQAMPPRAAAAPQRDSKESLIAANLFIEGKIQGSGDVRVAGQFKGDVDVQGDLTIEVGARVTGAVRAAKVTIAGELDGNVVSASRVELLATGIVNGDIKAGSLTVASGSRMRGQVDVGSEEKAIPKSSVVSNLQKAPMESGAAS
jgi:cytoskeletal protein CcmA (bactofilin family)